MSAVADVSEMQGICADIVRRLSRGLQKQQVPQLAKLIGVSENRALEFLRAKARRIDSWEKDRVREPFATNSDAPNGISANSTISRGFVSRWREAGAVAAMFCSICFAALAMKLAPWRYSRKTTTKAATGADPIELPED